MAQDNLSHVEPEILDGENASAVAPETKVQRGPANQDQFQGMLQKSQPDQVQGVATTDQSTSLMDAVRNLNTAPGKTTGRVASYESLVAQTQEAITKIDEVKKTLESPNITIKKSAQQILQNKLTHINESLEIALSRAGVELNPADIKGEAKVPATNPIERFLGFLTDGQYKLQNLGDELAQIEKDNKQLSPVNLLAIQVKVGQIQQELELFSSLLNKALESIKTVMNIQV